MSTLEDQDSQETDGTTDRNDWKNEEDGEATLAMKGVHRIVGRGRRGVGVGVGLGCWCHRRSRAEAETERFPFEISVVATATSFHWAL